jgi:CBS domain-containing protein
MAPELFGSGEVEYDNSIDVFAFGVMLWEACSRKLPFDDLATHADMITAIREGGRPPIPLAASPELKSLLQSCWHPDRAERPTFVELERIFAGEMSLLGKGKKGLLFPDDEALAAFAWECQLLPTIHTPEDLDRVHAEWSKLPREEASGDEEEPVLEAPPEPEDGFFASSESKIDLLGSFETSMTLLRETMESNDGEQSPIDDGDSIERLSSSNTRNPFFGDIPTKEEEEQLRKWPMLLGYRLPPMANTRGRIAGPDHQHWSTWTVNSLIPTSLATDEVQYFTEEEPASEALETLSRIQVVSFPVYRVEDVPIQSSDTEDSDTDEDVSPRRSTSHASSQVEGYEWRSPEWVAPDSLQLFLIGSKYTPRRCLVTGIVQLFDFAAALVDNVADMAPCCREGGTGKPSLGELKVKAICNYSHRSPVVCVTTGVPLVRLIRAMSAGCRRILVLNHDGHAVGVATITALLKRLHKEPESWQEVGELQLIEALKIRGKNPIRTVDYRSPVWRALIEFRSYRCPEMAIVDEFGRLRATMSASCLHVLSSPSDLLKPIHEVFGLNTAIPTEGEEAHWGIEKEAIIKIPTYESRQQAIRRPCETSQRLLVFKRDTPEVAGLACCSSHGPLSHASSGHDEHVETEAEPDHASTATSVLLLRSMQQELEGRSEGSASKQRSSRSHRTSTTGDMSSRPDARAFVVSRFDTLYHIVSLFVRFRTRRLYLVDQDFTPQIALSPMDIVHCLLGWLSEREALLGKPLDAMVDE